MVHLILFSFKKFSILKNFQTDSKVSSTEVMLKYLGMDQNETFNSEFRDDKLKHSLLRKSYITIYQIILRSPSTDESPSRISGNPLPTSISEPFNIKVEDMYNT